MHTTTTGARVALSLLVLAVAGCSRELPPEPPAGDGVAADDEEEPEAPPPLVTTITASPPHETLSREARFEFHASRETARFSCSLDDAAEVQCTSPYGFFGLPPGQHTFSVRAIDGLDVEETPQKHTWSILAGDTDGDGEPGGCLGVACQDAAPEVEPNDDAQAATDLGPLDARAWGALTPAGDVDHYLFQIAANASIRLETLGPQGYGQCGGIATKVELLDEAGQVLATGAEAGGGCARVSGAVHEGARGLPAGAYLVRVSSVDGVELPAYVLEAAYEALCGDGQRDIGESCDDGNVEQGDGCDASCRAEVDETEDNGAIESADDLGALPTTFTARLPQGDVDVFRFSLAAPSGVRVTTSSLSDPNQCPGDNSLELLDGAGAVRAADGDSGPGSCGRLDPSSHGVMRVLAAGDHLLRVTRPSAGIDFDYALGVEVLWTCGDGARGQGEICDDGNLVDGDGCSATCSPEGAGQEPNEDRTTASDLGPLPAVAPGELPSGDVDFYRFTLDRTAAVRVETTGPGGAGTCGGDTKIELQREDGTIIVGDDDAGEGLCSLVDPSIDVEAAALPAGTYFVKVFPYSSSTTISGYLLDVSVAWSCGDGAVEGAEVCDDGNTDDDDGCSSTCRLDEVEPNDSSSSANDVGALPRRLSGAITPGTDVDFYRFTLSSPTRVRIGTTGLPGRPCPGDTLLALFDEAGEVVARDDQSGGSGCALIDPASTPAVQSLPAGTYTVRVSSFDGGSIEAYLLQIEPLP